MVSPIAACYFCEEQINTETAIYLPKCSHIFHRECASNFLGSTKTEAITSCCICTTLTPIKQIRMRKHRRLAIPFSNLTPIPEDSELINLGHPVVQYQRERIYPSRIRILSKKYLQKAPATILQFVVKLNRFSQLFIKKQPDISNK